jgi:hypothetical protein
MWTLAMWPLQGRSTKANGDTDYFDGTSGVSLGETRVDKRSERDFKYGELF